VPWVRGGDTDLDNLVLLCRRHHVLCHAGGSPGHRTGRSARPHPTAVPRDRADAI
jgi:hypothetical protein